MREELRDNPHFDACEEFCLKWDQASFDGEFECKELDFFVPMVLLCVCVCICVCVCVCVCVFVCACVRV